MLSVTCFLQLFMLLIIAFGNWPEYTRALGVKTNVLIENHLVTFLNYNVTFLNHRALFSEASYCDFN